MKRINSVLLLMACYLTIHGAAQIAPSPFIPYEQYGVDAQNTNRTTAILDINKPEVKWALDLEGYSVKQTILCPDGTLIVTASKWSTGISGEKGLVGKVLAINRDGKVVWEREIEPKLGMCPATTSSGVVYVTSGEYLWAFNPDGSQKWEFNLENTRFSTPVVGSDGTLYVGAAKGLFAVSPDGKLKWSVQSIQDCQNPSLNLRGEIIVHADSAQGRGIYIIKPDGSTVRLIRPLGMPYVNITVDGRDKNIITQNEIIYCLNHDGQIDWQLDRTPCNSHNEASLGENGTIIMNANWDESLLCISSDGSKIWEADYIGLCFARPKILGDGKIIIGNVNGTIFLIGKNGQLIWDFTLPNPGIIDYAPAIGTNNTFYIGTREGWLYAIGAFLY